MQKFDVLQILSLGIVGLGFLLAVLSYRLLTREQELEQSRPHLVRAIYGFMAFSLALCFLGLIAQIYDRKGIEVLQKKEQEFLAQGASLPAYVINSQSMDRFYGDSTLAERNKFINTALLDINAAYNKFINTFAVSYSSPIGSALISVMNSQRQVALIPIIQGMGQGLSEYSFEKAVGDLSAYYDAGSVISALSTLQKDAGARSASAKAKLDLASIRTKEFMDDKWGKGIQTFWMPGQPLDFTVNTANQKTLEDWMMENGIEGVPLQALITGGAEELAKLQKKAVQDLNIPVK